MKDIYDKPIREKCECGKKVINHHMLCDSCCSKRDKLRNKKINIKKNAGNGKMPVINSLFTRYAQNKNEHGVKK